MNSLLGSLQAALRAIAPGEFAERVGRGRRLRALLLAGCALGAMLLMSDAARAFECQDANGAGADGANDGGVGANTACGDQANASGTQVGGVGANTALGEFSDAAGNGSHNTALGRGAIATGNSSTNVAIGGDAVAAGSNGANNIAIGVSSNSNGGNSTALGQSANASGNSSVAIGVNSFASQLGGTALGAGNIASGSGASSLGSTDNFATTASAHNSLAPKDRRPARRMPSRSACRRAAPAATRS